MKFTDYIVNITKGTFIKWLGANGWSINAIVDGAYYGRGEIVAINQYDGHHDSIYVEQIIEISTDTHIYRNGYYYGALAPGFRRSDQEPLWKFKEAISAGMTFDQDLLISGPDLSQVRAIAEEFLKYDKLARWHPHGVSYYAPKASPVKWIFKTDDAFLVEPI